MKNDEFEDSVLQCVQMWVKVDTWGSEARACEDIEEKEVEREVVV